MLDVVSEAMRDPADGGGGRLRSAATEESTVSGSSALAEAAALGLSALAGVVAGAQDEITVVDAQRRVAIRQVGKSSAVNSTLDDPIPGFPVVRLSASSDLGTIRLMHPKQKRHRGWGRRRRRQSGNTSNLND